jgi:hypothetical protein
MRWNALNEYTAVHKTWYEENVQVGEVYNGSTVRSVYKDAILADWKNLSEAEKARYKHSAKRPDVDRMPRGVPPPAAYAATVRAPASTNTSTLSPSPVVACTPLSEEAEQPDAKKKLKQETVSAGENVQTPESMIGQQSLAEVKKEKTPEPNTQQEPQPVAIPEPELDLESTGSRIPRLDYAYGAEQEADEPISIRAPSPPPATSPQPNSISAPGRRSSSVAPSTRNKRTRSDSEFSGRSSKRQRSQSHEPIKSEPTDGEIAVNDPHGILDETNDYMNTFVSGFPPPILTEDPADAPHRARGRFLLIMR